MSALNINQSFKDETYYNSRPITKANFRPNLFFRPKTFFLTKTHFILP